MCGIIGISSKHLIKDQLLQALKNLEYRGYDSVGIYLDDIYKMVGRVSNLENIVPFSSDSNSGLGHNRWATHGNVSRNNAHPFISFNNTFILVHNGIINNYLELKEQLINNNYSFNSDTDSEVIVNLLDFYYFIHHDSLKALELTLNDINGTYALGIINLKEKNKIYFAKKESPLIIGTHSNYNFIISDINSAYFLTNKFIILNDNEYGYLDETNIKIYNNKKVIQKEIKEYSSDNKTITKENYEHFMIKEIHDEPIVLQRILDTYTYQNQITISKNLIDDIKKSNKIVILGCGTSYHAGLIGKQAIEELAKIPVNVYLASEYHNVSLKDDNATYIFLSQSGETMDLKLAYNLLNKNSKIYTFTNVLTSSLAQISNEAFDLLADIEISVASTKAYVSEVALLLMIAYKLINKDEEYIKFINESIDSINKTLNNKEEIFELAKNIKDTSSIYYLGKGIDHLINLESSLKLKEISYIHSDSIYSGELKHGPIALISINTPVIGLITNKKNASSFLNNIKEVEARGAKVHLVSTSNLNINSTYKIDLNNEFFAPINVAPFFQLLSYYCAKLTHKDIDKPRNLAKSCTVE